MNYLSFFQNPLNSILCHLKIENYTFPTSCSYTSLIYGSILHFCWYFILFLSISGLQASVFSYVSEFHTKDSAPRAASFVSMFMPMIFIVSSIIGIILIPMNWSINLFFIKFVPWRLFIIAIATVNAANTIIFSFMPETPKFLLAINKPEEAMDVLRKMYEINTGNIKEVS